MSTPSPSPTPPSDRLREALAWLDSECASAERLLETMVRQNSYTRNREGVSAVVDRLVPELRAIGLAVETIPSAHYGPHVAFAGPAAGAPIVLVGHTDTVFPPGTFEGWKRDGDRVRGPGTFDMKGGIAVMLLALRAARRAGLLDRVAVRGVLVSDEEVGSPESQPILRERAAGAAAALVFESGRERDLIVTRRKGVASVRVDAHGVAAHAGNAHAQGRNAIWALARFVDKAQGLTDYPRGLTVNVGTVEGGTTKNTVPAHARCDVDLRFEAVADGRALGDQLRAAATEAAVPGTRVEVSPLAWRDPLERTEASAALAVEYGACQVESGLGAGEAPRVGGGSDACTTGAMGIPSIDGLGPRGRGYHTYDEEIDIGSLGPKAAALLRFLARRADLQPSP